MSFTPLKLTCSAISVNMPSLQNIVRRNFYLPNVPVVVEDYQFPPSDFLAYVSKVDTDFKVRKRSNMVEVVCSGMLNPKYVSDNLSDIASHDGFVIKVAVDGMMVSSRARRGEARPQETSLVLGFCTVYVKENFLYIATICALRTVNAIKGIAARLIKTVKEVASMLPNIKGVTLDALLYCRNPDLKAGDVQIDKCVSWLHDYYIDRGFALYNPHVTDPTGEEILEYAPDTSGKLHKVKAKSKIIKFDAKYTIPMVWFKKFFNITRIQSRK